jgi:hypothetical protein
MINRNKRHEIESETEKALEKIREANKKKSEERGKELAEDAFMGALDAERIKLFK